ncbi:MAG: hypothetical protein KTR14_09400 [Vampirovibrio sp.]|nr:hypothetical protein [Vampirovibrio sp.]
MDEPKVMSKIQQFVKKHNVELNTEKAADSRLLFYYLLNNIEEAYQTLDPGKLTTDQLARTVAESIQTLRNPTGNEKEPLRISNLTFSDGKRTILFRDKIHKLFYTAKTLPSGKTEMVFASDPVLPIEPMKDETAYWGKVDENTLVKLVPQASSIETGQITLPELMNASGNGELFWRPLNKIKAFA